MQSLQSLKSPCLPPLVHSEVHRSIHWIVHCDGYWMIHRGDHWESPCHLTIGKSIVGISHWVFRCGKHWVIH